MKLAQLLAPWLGDIGPDLDIQGIAVDDRQIKPGYLFLAYQGTHSNGAQYIPA